MIPMNPCKGISIAKPEEAVVDPLQEDEEKVLTKEKYGSKWGANNVLKDEYPDLVFTTKPGNLFLPQYGSREC